MHDRQDEKKKVCIYCEKWSSGGIESFIYNILSSGIIDPSHFEVDIIAAEIDDNSVFTNRLKERGISFYKLSGNRYNVLLNVIKISLLLKVKRYDVIHINAYHALSMCYAWVAKQNSIQVRIVHSHNSTIKKGKFYGISSIAHKISKRLFASNATQLLACSKQASNFMFSKSALYRCGWRFIPNGIDTERFIFSQKKRAEVRNCLGLTNHLVIGNVGRLSYQKNQEFLIRIFAEVQKRCSDSVLLLVGEGEEKSNLKKRAETYTIPGTVLFCGVTNRVEYLLWAMDVFAFPSHFEGLGISLIEAQCAGLPVVCSDRIPQEAIILDTTHSLSLSKSAAEWADSIIEAKNQVVDRLKCGECVIKNGFSIQNTARLIKYCYLEH